MKKMITIAGLHQSLYIFFEKWGILKTDASLQSITNIVTALEKLSASPKDLEMFPNLIEQGRAKLVESYYESALPGLKNLLKEYDKIMLKHNEIRDAVNEIRDTLDESEDDYYIHILNQIANSLEMYEADYFVKQQIAGLIIEDAQDKSVPIDMLNIFLLLWNLEPYLDGKRISESLGMFEDTSYELEIVLEDKRRR